MKHDFEQRRQRRIANANNRAIKNQREADDLYQSAKQMADFIPFGQPILVGHHSEKRDRRYRDKMHNTFGKSFEKQEKAGYYSDKAEQIAHDNNIYSDDPDALQKLQSRLDDLIAIQTFMKAANKCLKKQDKTTFLTLRWGSENLWQQLNEDNRRVGFMPYQLMNNGANIRRIEQRMAALKLQETKPVTDRTINGIRIFENHEANRLQLIFDDKPSGEVRQQLKQHGFRWSPTEGAWQRHISNHALYCAEQIANHISEFN